MNKYKIFQLGKDWGIKKRILFFFWKTLCFSKVVTDAAIVMPSHEQLYYKNKSLAIVECSRLNSGELKPIVLKHYTNGRVSGYKRKGESFTSIR